MTAPFERVAGSASGRSSVTVALERPVVALRAVRAGYQVSRQLIASMTTSSVYVRDRTSGPEDPCLSGSWLLIGQSPSAWKIASEAFLFESSRQY